MEQLIDLKNLIDEINFAEVEESDLTDVTFGICEACCRAGGGGTPTDYRHQIGPQK